MDDTDRLVEDALQRGRENARVVHLAREHCALMRFEVYGGVGIVEEQTGLPIGMRSISCPVAHGNSAAAVLLPLASGFYREHCPGCDRRVPSGNVPNLATLVAEQDAQEEDARVRQAAQDADARELHAVRARARLAIASSSDDSMSGVLDDVGVLDSPPRSEVTDAEREKARVRIGRLADVAPETFTTPVVDHLFDLVAAGLSYELLDSLRRLARAREDLADRVADAALDTLRRGATGWAGQCVAELADRCDPAAIDAAVCRSLVVLAGWPTPDHFGMSWLNRTNEPSGLISAARIVPDTVVGALRRLLPRRPPASTLIVPGAARHDPAPVSSLERASAANAVSALVAVAPEVVETMLGDLVAACALEPDDTHNDPAVPALQRALALAFVLHVGDVAAQIEAAAVVQSDSEFRSRLFGVFALAAELVERDGEHQERDIAALEDADRDSVRSRIATIAIAHVQGDWGESVLTDAASLIEHLARTSPGTILPSLPGVLGAILHLDAASRTPPRVVLEPATQPDPRLQAMEQLSRSVAMEGATGRLIRSVSHAARLDPVTVCADIITIIGHERQRDPESMISARLIKTVGEIARRDGDEIAVLQLALPFLHGSMVAEDVIVRSAALEAWINVAARHGLPASFQDLLPALIVDAHIGVAMQLLRAATALEWDRGDQLALTHYALNLTTPELARSHPDLAQRAISALGRLAKPLGPQALAAAERTMLAAAAELEPYELSDVLRRAWSPVTARSPQMAQLRLRQAADPRINDQYNAHDEEELCALLSCGRGLTGLDRSTLRHAALQWLSRSPVPTGQFVEVAWRTGDAEAASSIARDALEVLPHEPAYAQQRQFIQLIVALAEVDRLAHSGEEWSSAADRAEDACTSIEALADPRGTASWMTETARALLRIRRELTTGPSPLHDEPAALKTRAASLRDAAISVTSAAQRATDTCAYLRAVADACRIAERLLRSDAATLRAKPTKAEAHVTAARHAAEGLVSRLNERFAQDDPLAQPLLAILQAFVIDTSPSTESLLSSLAALAMPLPIVRGPARIVPRGRAGRGTAKTQPSGITDEDAAVAVVLASIDGRRVTGPEVLHPDQVYDFELAVDTGPWPSWAHRLDAEVISHLTSAEVTIPSLTWSRTEQTRGAAQPKNGSLVLRFALGAGQRAPEFRFRLTWHGQRDGTPVRHELDVTGHRSLRLRPYDATRDRFTDYPVLDERLLAMYERFAREGHDDQQLQAFCRLMTAVCRAGSRMTWEQRYKRGARVTERSFHDDLHERLMADPDLGGRVERGSPLGLGYLDVRHDGVTAELKVERTTPVTPERAHKYLGQPTQYASADGTRLAVLVVLDISAKQQPVGVPENYVFTLEPHLHGLNDPRYPSVVAVLVVNAANPVPSWWSRRKITSRAP